MATTESTPSQTTSAAPGEYAACEECGAPLDEKQRYCVSCGARRRDASAPTSRYFAGAARKTRRSPGRAAAPSGARAAAVLFFVVLPIAVAIGVLVGKGNGGGNNDQQLADAIKNLQASGGGNAALASTAAAATPITSDFTLDKGYTVELKTLPVDGTDQAAVDAAKKAASDQGAADVGIINTSEFTVTPAPPANTYVLYSGQFKSKSEATKALGKLKAKFKDAQVVSVKKASSSGEGKLVSKTAYGDVHKVEGFTPTPQKVASDTALVQQQAQKVGKNYVDSQKDLPDVIVVGGSGGGASNPAAQGNGD